MQDHDRHARMVAPLFDRLRSTKSAAEPQPLATLSRRELHESICRELSGLLNVRSPLTADRYCEQPLTVLDYGIPDLTALSPQHSDDAKRLCRLITRAITAFEPRLTGVQTSLTVLDGRAGLLLTCTAALVNDSEPLHLTVLIPGPGGADQLVSVDLPPEA
ncbi:MAG TPA: type VI secretion system baseplate subunit TssE [Herpetosiphonaceae bacterium]